MTVSNLVNQLGVQAHVRGVILETSLDMDPAVYGGIPALAAPRITSLRQADTYLRRVPLERRFVALSLDARHLTPADAAHLASNVAGRYVVVPPLEMMALMLAANRPRPRATRGSPSLRRRSRRATVDPMSPVPVEAEITPESGRLRGRRLSRGRESLRLGAPARGGRRGLPGPSFLRCAGAAKWRP